MYILLNIYTHTCPYAYTHTHTYIYTRTHTHTHFIIAGPPWPYPSISLLAHLACPHSSFQKKNNRQLFNIHTYELILIHTHTQPHTNMYTYTHTHYIHCNLCFLTFYFRSPAPQYVNKNILVSP